MPPKELRVPTLADFDAEVAKKVPADRMIIDPLDPANMDGDSDPHENRVMPDEQDFGEEPLAGVSDGPRPKEPNFSRGSNDGDNYDGYYDGDDRR